MTRAGQGRSQRVLARMVDAASACADALERSELPGTADLVTDARSRLSTLTGSPTVRTRLTGDVLVTMTAACRDAGVALPAGAWALVVRALAADLEERHGGSTIEVRIPPLAAVQLAAAGVGPSHTRGTPPNVVEITPEAWFDLAVGRLTWPDALAQGSVRASGAEAQDVAGYLPVVRLPHLPQRP